MTAPNLREATLQMIRRQLAERFPSEQHNNPASLDQFAEGLQAVSVEYEIPIIEGLIFWLHDRVEGKVWSLESWRAWCQRYNTLRAELAPPPQICPRCVANAMVRSGEGVWWCSRCGEVQ